MKMWLKWLAECDYKFTRIDNGEDDVRVYDFGNGLIVYKREKGKGSNGGTVIYNNYTTFHGSVKDLTKRIDEILSK